MSNFYFIFFTDSHRRVIVAHINERAIRVLVSLMTSTTDKVNYKTHHIIWWFHIMEVEQYLFVKSNIREYGSTLYVGMAWEKNGGLYISIASDELKSLVIYTDKF